LRERIFFSQARGIFHSEKFLSFSPPCELRSLDKVIANGLSKQNRVLVRVMLVARIAQCAARSQTVKTFSDFRKLSIFANMSAPEDPHRVLSIQSHVVHGYCGNKSAVFPLQVRNSRFAKTARDLNFVVSASEF
jgi:hypothetical protein